MSKPAIEVSTSGQRRRRWGVAEKEQLVAASLVPGAGVSAVVREQTFIQASCMDGGGSCARDHNRQPLRRYGLQQNLRRLACLVPARLTWSSRTGRGCESRERSIRRR
jgi:transposase-like protein